LEEALFVNSGDPELAEKLLSVYDMQNQQLLGIKHKQRNIIDKIDHKLQ
jgi:flagellin-specific chaperone FliS